MVNIYKPELTPLQEGILKFLMINAGKTFTARHLSISLEVSQPAISKALPGLEKKGFVLVDKNMETKRFSIQLNLQNSRVIQLKRAENLKQIYVSGLQNYLIESFPGSLIVLFGSFSFGEDLFNSDIDIAVIGNSNKKINTSKYEKMLGKKVIINFYTDLDAIDSNLKSNICNGIVLAGRISL